MVWMIGEYPDVMNLPMKPENVKSSVAKDQNRQP
jgi:hypothetical protein